MTLNQFTGASTKTLERRLANLKKTYDEITEADGWDGGGSPREGIIDRIDDLEIELKRRLSASSADIPTPNLRKDTET